MVTNTSNIMAEDDTDEEAVTFEAGDHITLPCNAVLGIPYDHHAIVLSASKSTGNEWTLCVADFDNFAGGSSRDGPSSSNSNSDDGEALVSITDDMLSQDNKKQKQEHGLRVLCINNANKWHKIHYSESAQTDKVQIVRRRVEFLLKHPQYIPSYCLVKSNCECVAVWCKTGKWTTLQAEKWLGTTNFTSRIAIAGLSIASLSAVAIPFGGLILAGSVATEVISGIMGDRAKRTWEEQTKTLNEAFDNVYVARDEKKKKKGESNNSSIIPTQSSSRLIGDPFSDTRSLRSMVDAYQRADALLSMVDKK